MNKMNGKIIVTYASKYGATAEIAEKIAAELDRVGLETQVLPVERAMNLSSYSAVILGSAVYIGKWRKEAVAFLQSNEDKLAKMPMWLYSSGPTGEGDPVELLEGWKLPAEVQPVAERIHPRDIAVFHGHINPGKLNFIEKQLLKGIKKPMGDYRDWNAITAWAQTIAQALNHSEEQ
jgi:menaquinone-dependent protoporphyrinogen oxidase